MNTYSKAYLTLLRITITDLLSVKYRVVISTWALAICAAIPPDDVQAQEIATADSVRKYKFLAKTAREKKEYDAAIG